MSLPASGYPCQPKQSASLYITTFDASGLSSGAYIYRIQAGEDVVKVLVNAGADINMVPQHFTRTALGWAQSEGHDEVERYLRSKGGKM